MSQILPPLEKLKVISRLHESPNAGATRNPSLGAIALAAAFVVFAFGSPQPAGATELGPFFWVEPPTVQVEDRPKPLYAPYGYYGYQGGCSRQPVWQGRQWRSVTVCRR